MHTQYRFLSIVLAAGWLLHTPAAAHQEPGAPEDRLHGSEHEHDAMEEVRVQATPLARDALELSQSATVLSGEALQREAANSLGDTLSRMPGLANASFGQNVGRPVIRGLQGARIGVLTDNLAVGDASAVSQDHAVAIEPFLAEQVEVLRGPATLLYGSGAIGGVVNVVTGAIPEEVPEAGFEGRAMLQADSAADQQFAGARLDAGRGSLAFHADAFYRRTDDYEIPGTAERYPEHDEEQTATGVLENSFLDNEGGSIGASWLGERWRAGLSWTGYDSDYGIPGGHGHEEDDAGDGDEEEPEGEVSIRLDSGRLNGELVGTDPFGGFEQFKALVATTDYRHTEFEGSEVGTVFDTDTVDARLELRHRPWGAWSGAFGAQYTKRDFSAVGEEAFLPPSRTDTSALFWVESGEYDSWTVDVGIRYEDVDTSEAGGAGASRRRSFGPLSVSAGVIHHLSERTHLALTAARAERAPADQELFADGPHVASQTFEVGNPGLEIESDTHVEGSWRMHGGRLTGSVTVYHDEFDGYIYQADTGETRDGFPVRLWSQQDAAFTGGEVELRYDFGRNAAGHWQLFGFADRVRAEFGDSSAVPRIPPRRFGLGLDWDNGPWIGNLTWVHASGHTDVAEFETPTPGYDLVNVEWSRSVFTGDRADVVVYLKAHNLLDEEVRNSASLLKDQAPQIGRNFVLGVRSAF